MLDISLANLPTPEPTLPPNMQPPPENSKDKTDTALIVAIALGSVAGIGLVSFIAVWYITRRKPDIMLDEDFVDHDSSHGDNMDLVLPSLDDPRVFGPDRESR